MGKKISAKKSKKKELKTNNESQKKEKNSNLKLNFTLVKRYLPIFLILVVMFFAFYVRSGPINLNGLEDRVEINTYGQLRSLISSNLEQSYANLMRNSPQDFQNLVNQEFDKVVKSGVYEFQGQKVNINDLIKQNQQLVRSAFKDDTGQTYLNAIDPYYFLHLSTNYYEYGHTGDTLVDGKPILTTQMSPIGKVGTYKPQFHVWLESKLFSIFNIDKTNPSIGDRTRVIFLIPVILAMLCVIPIFLILRKYSNDLFAVFGSLLLVSVGTFVSRTIAGFVDTDGYVVLFPLLIFAFVLYSFVSKNKRVMFCLSVIAGFFQGLFLWSWTSGWFIFVFLSLALIGYLIYLVIFKYVNNLDFSKFQDEIYNSLISLFGFWVSSLIFTFLFVGRNIFTMAFNGVLNSQSMIAGIGSTLWPNVYSSVAELNPASFRQIISSVGGEIIFILALMGIVFLSLDWEVESAQFKKIKRGLAILALAWFYAIIFMNIFVFLTQNHPFIFLIILFVPVAIALIMSLFAKEVSNKIFFAIVLSIWLAGTIYMSLNGVRFILLLAPAFSMAFALGLYYISEILNYFIVREFNTKSQFRQFIGGFVVTSILFLILFVPMAIQATAISEGTTPNFDDAWYSAMYKIENSSNSDAIITSWWDFGHFFAAVSHRGVTFDGGSQTTPRAHWVGKLLLESDEEKSVDILRMLVCGGNTAFEKFYDDVGKDGSDVVKINRILYDTFGKDRDETRAILENNKYYSLTKEQVDDIMDSLDCENPREDFLITSGDMVGKAGVWAHWGSWDFTKKYVYNNYNKMSADEMANKIDVNVSLVEKYIDELREIDLKSNLENINRDSLINQWFAIYPGFLGNGNCVPQNTSVLCGVKLSLTPNGGVRSLSATDYPGFEGCSQVSGGAVCGYKLDLESGIVTTKDFPFGQKPFGRILGLSSQNSLGVYKTFEGANFDILLIPNSQNNVRAYLSNTPLGNSLFMKLFYLNGFTTKHFEKFDEENSMTGVNVKVWKVKWDVNESTENKVEDLFKNTNENSLNTTAEVNVSLNESIGEVTMDSNDSENINNS